MNLGKTEEVQVEFQVEKKDEMIQTGEEKESSKNELLEEAMMLVNKHNNKLKTSCFNGSETNREVLFKIKIHEFFKNRVRNLNNQRLKQKELPHNPVF